MYSYPHFNNRKEKEVYLKGLIISKNEILEDIKEAQKARKKNDKTNVLSPFYSFGIPSYITKKTS